MVYRNAARSAQNVRIDPVRKLIDIRRRLENVDKFEFLRIERELLFQFRAEKMVAVCVIFRERRDILFGRLASRVGEIGLGRFPSIRF